MRPARVCLVLGMLAHAASALPADYTCAADPAIVAPCFDVRGRLSFWNGAPSARIWRIGTARMLGIHADLLPLALAALRTSFDTEIRGTFSVCPFTRSVAGHMQFVCIDAWRDLSVRARSHAAAPRSSSTGRVVVHE